MKRHRGLFLGLALSALMSLSASQAQAETISMAISVTGGASLDIDIILAPGAATATSYTVDTTALATINAFLAGQGSEYQVATLGGNSNFPGDTTGGQLTVTGAVKSVGTGNAGLTITETETAFTSPTGPTGTLFSSSSATFNGQPAGGGHTASSSFNGTSTSTYSVLSSGTTPNSPGMSTSTPIAPVPTLYTLGNTITFGLAPGTAGNPIVDSFGVTATITAAAVPEPASLVMMLTGIPLPIVVIGLLRRRRAAV